MCVSGTETFRGVTACYILVLFNNTDFVGQLPCRTTSVSEKFRLSLGACCFRNGTDVRKWDIPPNGVLSFVCHPCIRKKNVFFFSIHSVLKMGRISQSGTTVDPSQNGQFRGILNSPLFSPGSRKGDFRVNFVKKKVQKTYFHYTFIVYLPEMPVRGC